MRGFWLGNNHASFFYVGPLRHKYGSMVNLKSGKIVQKNSDF